MQADGVPAGTPGPAAPRTTLPRATTSAAACRNTSAAASGEAARLYRYVLGAQSKHLDALSLLGVLALRQRDHRGAADRIGRAVSRNPGNAAYHANLAEALRGLIPSAAHGGALARPQRVAGRFFPTSAPASCD